MQLLRSCCDLWVTEGGLFLKALLWPVDGVPPDEVSILQKLRQCEQ